MWEGLTNREIAKIVGTTEQVIKNYLRTSHGGADWASKRTATIEGEVPIPTETAAVAYAGR